MATSKGKILRIENRTRNVYHIPVEGGVPDWMAGHLVLGDKADTEDVVPASGRDNRLQPSPVVDLAVDQAEQLGSKALAMLKDLAGQGLIRIDELAA